MFPERYFGITVHQIETKPLSIKGILTRFGREYERDIADEKLDSLADTPFGSLLLGELGEKFKPGITTSECPSYILVLAGSLLAGKTNPSDIERLNKILCGHIVTKEDNIGFLSGRRGTDYQPLSQCWKTTIELMRLVEFMKIVEDTPEIDNTISDELELREVLNERDRIKSENFSRQMVFVTWNQLRSKISSWLQSEQESKQLSRPKVEVENDEKALIVINKKVLDVASQLDVGGVEYQELTAWVESTVLAPLLELVGENNMAIYSGAKSFRLSFRDTAEHCPEKPRSKFYGSYSLIPAPRLDD